MSKTVLWVENCFPISSRSERIIDSLKMTGKYKVRVCAWERSGASHAHADYLYAAKAEPRRLVRKALALPGYSSFVRMAVRSVRPDVIACSNWDMALLASLNRRAAPVVYDVGDIPDGRGLYRMLGRILESAALQRVDAVILASRFFEGFYQSYGARRLVLENLPAFSPEHGQHRSAECPPRLAFVGNVRFEETLRPLLRVAAFDLKYPVVLYGGGPALKALSAEFEGAPSIQFAGPYAYRAIPDIYSSIDVVWAAYPSRDVNVKYAISNKFFESILFGVPGVYSAGTELARLVDREGIGFVLNAQSPHEVRSLLLRLLEEREIYNSVRERLIKYRSEQSHRLTWADQEAGLHQLFDEISGR